MLVSLKKGEKRVNLLWMKENSKEERERVVFKAFSFFFFRFFLVNTQTFLGEDKCSEVGDGIEQSEDAELQPLLALLQPRTLARIRGAGPSMEEAASS